MIFLLQDTIYRGFTPKRISCALHSRIVRSGAKKDRKSRFARTTAVTSMVGGATAPGATAVLKLIIVRICFLGYVPGLVLVF